MFDQVYFPPGFGKKSLRILIFPDFLTVVVHILWKPGCQAFIGQEGLTGPISNLFYTVSKVKVQY